MVKYISVVVASALVACASAFAPGTKTSLNTKLSAKGFEEVGGEPWDPMSLSKLADINAFPGMFPREKFLAEAEKKHGRMAMLAWTGAWATTATGLGLGMHIPGMPVEPDWTVAASVVGKEQPALWGSILLFIGLAEGESVGRSAGERLVGSKEPGDLNFDPLGLTKKLSEEKLARYKIVEQKNGRAAMIAMASLFAWKSIPGSVPIMDVLAPN